MLCSLLNFVVGFLCAVTNIRAPCTCTYRIFDPDNKELIERAAKAFPKKRTQPDPGDDGPEEWMEVHPLACVPGETPGWRIRNMRFEMAWVNFPRSMHMVTSGSATSYLSGKFGGNACRQVTCMCCIV